MSAPLPVHVVGAGGLLAGELLRLAAGHPALAPGLAVTREPGGALAALHPHLGSDLRTSSLDELARTLAREPGGSRAAGDAGALLVLGLPHGETARTWRALREELGEAAGRVLVVDLSADYRLADVEAYARWYGPHPDPEELARFRYGLPELVALAGGPELAGARRVAAPGCFATALQLACVPAARAGLLEPERTWVVNAVTGSSGSGAKPGPGTHHPHRDQNLWAYALDGHRHEAELFQALGFAPPLVFVPHSGPFVRGIHLTAVLPLARPLAAEEARALYAGAYEGRPFVEVVDEQGRVPDLRRVVGSNRAALQVHVREGALVVLVTLDNVVKGGAGQALQAANLALGWPEDLGLPRAGLGVV